MYLRNFKKNHLSVFKDMFLYKDQYLLIYIYDMLFKFGSLMWIFPMCSLETRFHRISQPNFPRFFKADLLVAWMHCHFWDVERWKVIF